jgi:hypothetical protein
VAVNFSRGPTAVASEWIASVSRPPPPTAVKKCCPSEVRNQHPGDVTVEVADAVPGNPTTDTAAAALASDILVMFIDCP